MPICVWQIGKYANGPSGDVMSFTVIVARQGKI